MRYFTTDQWAALPADQKRFQACKVSRGGRLVTRKLWCAVEADGRVVVAVIRDGEMAS
jgi:hypothetical protein